MCLVAFQFSGGVKSSTNNNIQLPVHNMPVSCRKPRPLGPTGLTVAEAEAAECSLGARESSAGAENAGAAPQSPGRCPPSQRRRDGVSSALPESHSRSRSRTRAHVPLWLLLGSPTQQGRTAAGTVI